MRFRIGCCRHGRSVFSALAVAAMLVGATGSGVAQQTADGQKLIGVNWDDPELTSLNEARSLRAPGTFSADDLNRLNNLRLPVLAFDGAPAALERSLARSPQAPPKRSIAFDKDNPYWYSITDEYDGMTVTVEAERRVQHVLPDTTLLNEQAFGESRGAFERSFPDDTEVPGEEGYIVEFTTYKFGKNGAGIPYTVTIECDEDHKQDCQAFDRDVQKREELLLKLIAARRPQ